MDNTISKIENDSPLHRRAHVGDVLVSINGNKVHDVLDYKFVRLRSTCVSVATNTL